MLLSLKFDVNLYLFPPVFQLSAIFFKFPPTVSFYICSMKLIISYISEISKGCRGGGCQGGRNWALEALRNVGGLGGGHLCMVVCMK
ncbi:hypothetical protein BT96DRAFT_478542 [Gymnopus androsaceus JB14]|uniref:Uncharacterized protein n=1 Tax=Gymnopus androsaceus JB14 TaxID=1447944 RepID=A0A6A4GQ65_9AGAR|nr:hypothetical protein BT96DRAFT_478542 [Gymnopus androsaceus JB14]